MGSEQKLVTRRGILSTSFWIFNKKSVLHIPGRMICRKIQFFEVMLIVLDLRTISNVESHVDKNFDHRIQGFCQGMLMAGFGNRYRTSRHSRSEEHTAELQSLA